MLKQKYKRRLFFYPDKISAWLRLRLIVILLLTVIFGLTACAFSPFALIGEQDAPALDPLLPYRAALQPAAQANLETTANLPRYRLTVELSGDGNTLTGIAVVTLTSTESEAVFRLYPNLQNYGGQMQITAAFLNDAPVDFTSMANNTAIGLALPQPDDGDAVAAEQTITLNFTVTLPRRDTANYVLFGWHGDTLSLPGFYPALAARQSGQWILDDPPAHADVLFHESALYELALTLPASMAVATSGATLKTVDQPDSRRTWQIAGGPLRDMTVVAGPFETISEQAAGARVTAYYLPGHQPAAQAALIHAAASLRLYSDTFGPYPYTELAVVQAPLNYRGMEYSGLVLIGTDLYQSQRQHLTFLVAHEVAHQWWYNVVGSNPYQHPWLDEGLTEYSAFDYYRGVFGRADAEALLTQRWQTPFDVAAAGGVDGRIDRPVAAFDAYNYELLVYTKAALFFDALRTQLGDDLYYEALQTYYAENRYRIATPQTFLATAERVSGQNLNPLAEKWLR